MSGGQFDYQDIELINKIIEQLQEDDYPTQELIRLVSYVGNILHAYDWFQCGDTNEGEYKKEYYQNINHIKILLK